MEYFINSIVGTSHSGQATLLIGGCIFIYLCYARLCCKLQEKLHRMTGPSIFMRVTRYTSPVLIHPETSKISIWKP